VGHLAALPSWALSKKKRTYDTSRPRFLIRPAYDLPDSEIGVTDRLDWSFEPGLIAWRKALDLWEMGLRICEFSES